MVGRHLSSELPKSGLGAQYDNPLWGPLPNNRSATSVATLNNLTCWNQLIIDQEDTEDTWSSTIYRQRQATPEGCPVDTDFGHWTCKTSSICSTTSMATGANSQTGHFSANHLSSKTNSGPSPGTSMLSSQVAANRSWGSGPPHCPAQSSVGTEGKNDSPVTGGNRGWGSSSSSTTNFNLNLNPNANPSAWPMLGHDVAGNGAGSSGGAISVSPPPSTQTSTCTGANTNSNPAGGSSAWGGIMASDSLEPKNTPSTNVSFCSEPQNLKTDGPNFSKQESPSPIHSRSGWGNAPVGCNQEGPQVNGEDASSTWVKSGDSNAPSSKDGWDSGWSRGGGGAGTSGGWVEPPKSDWGKPKSDEAQGGWDAPTSPTEGSSDSMEGHPRQRDCSSRENPAPVIPAQDLDPRVLCNTGWGQTPVRQHTTWDMEESKRKKLVHDSWGAGPAVSNDTQGHPTNMVPPHRTDSVSKHDVHASPVASGWNGSAPAPNQSSSGWGDGPNNNNNKPPAGPSGWNSPTTGGQNTNVPQKGAQSWVEEKSAGWQSHAKTTSQGWGDQPKPSPSWSNSGRNSNAGEWSESGESKKSTSNAAWDGEPGGWKESPRSWSSSTTGPGNSENGRNAGWGEPACQRPSGPPQGWGGKSNEGPAGGGALGSWGGTGPVKQSAGWSGGKQERTASTGWEEPSPPSIRRKMEIDDGTSAWGDPGSHNKSVNLWDRNNPGVSQNKANTVGNNTPGSNTNLSQPHSQPYHPPQGPSQNHSQTPQNPGLTGGPMDSAAPQPPVLPHNRGPPMAQGWGDMPSSHTKSESTWGEHAPSPVSVDNGTSAWGKPTSGWGDSSQEYGRSNSNVTSASCKTAPKPMQDSWGGGGEELGLSGGQWDTDDGDMWNSTASQESNSSCNSWGNASKKAPPKVKVPGKQEDVWIMNRLIKQLTDMGFPRDPAEEALKSNNMNLDQAMSALLEKKSELDKRGMSIGHDYNNGLINKPMNCPRPQLLSKDPVTDPRLAFMDKMQSGMFGGGSAQGRAMQPPPQPPVPPLGSSQPNLRAQVPPFLSPQVQAQLLQFAAKNIGLNPALLTSPINPQNMTLLNQLYQLQLAYQRLQIQQQMLQAQRNVSGPIRQQEQQVARTINNMQQQIQQHQRQLAQALLMKQQQPPPAHSGMHLGGNKSSLDSFPGHPQAPGLSDLQTKDPQSSANSYSPYSLSGLNSNMNVNCLDMGGLSLKESPQPQSRLSQWTHANSIESISETSSPLESSLGKHGANLGPPGKSPQLEDSFSPYNLMSNSESPTSPLVPPDNWGQPKGSSDKMTNGTNINWPPEFCPGVPWKGLQNIDPETDPNMTPGSVHSGPTINTNIQDVNRYLMRDRSGGSSPTSSQALPLSTDWPVNACTSSFSLSSPETDNEGKLSEIKSTWSPGPIPHSQASLSHELWKVPQGPRNSSAAPSRPPPGLTNNKPSATWAGTPLGLSQGWSSSYTTAGTTWSTDSSSRTSSWLVLRNLTPQIDGSTLRTLCMQHGPLITFHLNLTQGNAVVRYNSKDEAAKAQKSLHMCVLGNTTILAEFAGEEEVNRFFAQSQSLGGTTSWQATPGSNQTRMGGTGSGVTHPIGHSHWNNNSGGAGTGGTLGTVGAKTGELLWGGVQQYSSLWGPPNGEEARVMGSPTQINTLLPGDLLSGESM
ncbi:trinucleotide repeat-containing gene 6C protein-like [Eucyclogobius newberryi]|uniref:trinucleotide repeat-containing gene 6C protein-like n=1 Tax=Eucyclogobius newberryi TaxID=166745 RepID=UPI003B5AE1C7